MHSTIRSTVRATPIVLTPPTSTRAVSDARTASSTRSKKKGLRDLFRAEPTAAHFAIAAAIYWSVPWLLALLKDVRLPHDAFSSVASYLLWSSGGGAARLMTPLLQGALLIHVIGAAALTAAALLPREKMFAPVHATAARFYRFAIVLPLWTIVAAHLGRFVADEVYALGGIITWDITPVIARLETPVVEWVQRSAASNALSTLASNLSAAIWVTPLAFGGIMLVAVNKPKILCSLLVAYGVMFVCAIPLFVLLPTFAPWTTNPVYGARELSTGIRYLSEHPSVATLGRINTYQHWSIGMSLPSLQTAFPLVTALVLRKHRMRAASLVMLVAAVITMFAGVYLGRHWVTGALLAGPFSYAVVEVAIRVRLRLVLPGRSAARLTLRPNEIAVPSEGNADNVQWLSGAFFISGFAALIYQVVWQRTLIGIIGLTSESVTLVVTAFALGLGAGSLVGGAISKRPGVRFSQLFGVAQIGIGAFGFFSIAVLRFLGTATLTMSPSATMVTTFTALLPPTILIGATLPLLVTNEVRAQRSVGAAVGRLYFTNALGAALAASLAALVLLGPLGQETTVQIAAVMNVGMGLLIYVRSRRGLVGRR